ncbi:16095_t:CDS:2 [Funneliformis geosporum]|uniref:16095_t:CDS:1 n=1 Tax=Funneliformis geosporum TaxID=1117311 RepID=A0A9W4SY08_9GLOM|nr:16095_t:CDS:2 [Funneliformis geosporum]
MKDKKSQSHKKREAENIVQDAFDFTATSAPEKNHVTKISMTETPIPVTENTDEKNSVVMLSDNVLEILPEVNALSTPQITPAKADVNDLTDLKEEDFCGGEVENEQPTFDKFANPRRGVKSRNGRGCEWRRRNAGGR